MFITTQRVARFAPTPADPVNDDASCDRASVENDLAEVVLLALARDGVPHISAGWRSK